MANPPDHDDPLPEPGQLAREVADWEYVSKGLRSYTQRKQVPGGWIYRTVVENHPAICFVPNAGEPSPTETPEEETQG